VDALQVYLTPKAQKLFEKYSVLSKEELHSRYEIYIEQYYKHINIEALSAVKMSRTLYIPTAMRFSAQLAEQIGILKKASVTATVQGALLGKVNKLLTAIAKKTSALETAAAQAKSAGDATKQAISARDTVCTALSDLRESVDELETITPADVWPVPVYSDMLFKL